MHAHGDEKRSRDTTSFSSWPLLASIAKQTRRIYLSTSPSSSPSTTTLSYRSNDTAYTSVDTSTTSGRCRCTYAACETTSSVLGVASRDKDVALAAVTRFEREDDQRTGDGRKDDSDHDDVAWSRGEKT